MNRLIVSLSIIKAVLDKHTGEYCYIDSFMPFIAALLNKHKYNDFTIETLSKDFEKEFGFVIPFQPMSTIITRAKKRGLVKQKNKRYYGIQKNIEEEDITNTSLEQEIKQEKIIKAFVKYAQEKENITIVDDDAERVMLAYLKEHDFDLLAVTKTKSILPEVEVSRSHKYIFYKFLINILENDTALFEHILDISIGHIYATALLYSDITRNTGSAKNIKFYIDTPFILGSLGIDGEYRAEVNTGLLKLINESKGKLKVFQHTYNEVISNLSDCKKWVSNPYYDQAMANPTCRYFVENGLSASDIEMMIIKLDRLIDEYHIRIENIPSNRKHKEFQIDEKRMKELIGVEYHISSGSERMKKMTDIVENDVRSLSGIHMIRGSIKVHSLKRAKAIFLTTNPALVSANMQYEHENNLKDSRIRSCATDIYIGTLLWLQSPIEVTKLNIKRIISNCYSALQPDENLLRKFISTASRLNKETSISDEDLLLLRSSKEATILLVDKTHGDIQDFTEGTVLEIIDSIKKDIVSESEQKYLKEVNQHDLTKAKLNTEEIKNKTVQNNIEALSRKWAEQIARIAGIFFFLVFCIGGVFQIIALLVDHIPNAWLPILIVTIIVGVFASLFGLDVFTLKTKFSNYLKNILIKWFTIKFITKSFPDKKEN